MIDFKVALASAVSVLAFGGMQQTADAQTAETQTAETQTAETQTAETQTAETQTAETQTAETQTAETQAAEAQAAGATPAQAVQVFDPVFFARFNPVTAADMVRQVPGFSINNGDSVRGFGGSAGNVLINGRRPSSKTNVSDELGRIAARDVLRVELIGAAAAGDIDVRGYTELANVVLRSAAGVQVSTTWQGEVEYQEGARIGGRIGGTRAWKTDTFGARLNAQVLTSPEREISDIVVSAPNGAVLSRSEQFEQRNFSELLLTGSLDWTATDRDTISVNGRLSSRLFDRQSGQVSRDSSGAIFRYVTDDWNEKDILHADLGGDWERRFDNGATIKLIAVNRSVNWRPKQLFEEYPGGVLAGQTRVNADNRVGEHVLRGVATLKPSPAHTLEFGAEGAFNYRNIGRSLASNVCAPVCTGFVPINLPVASTRVEEQRTEAFITDVWRVNPQFTLETGFIWEVSTITQTGDASQERDFSYPKPRAIATWTPTAQDQVRLALEREVAQLDFGEFAANVSFIDNHLVAGNPDLRPEQAWKASAQWKRQIGMRGSLSLTGFFDQVEDVQDYTVLETAPGVYFTGAGNIGDGQRWGARLALTMPLDAVGLPNALLKFNTMLQDSRVDDPLTGEPRRFAGQIDQDWYVEFRQDVPELQFAWGGDYYSVGPSRSWRLDEIRKGDFSEGDLDLFIETTRFFGGALVRFSADNIFEARDERDRDFYFVGADPFAAPRTIRTRHETREDGEGRNYSITIAGSF